MREICDTKGDTTHNACKLRQLLMRPLEKFFQKPELAHDFQRGRMNGVAAEVAQEILVFLKHANLNARACQKQSKHHSGRSAAGNAAPGLDTVLVQLFPQKAAVFAA